MFDCIYVSFIVFLLALGWVVVVII